MRRAAVLALAAAALGGCMAAQSARVIRPGRTTVNVAAARVASAAIPGDDQARARWFGQVAIRRGLTRRFDAAVIAARTVGQFGAVYALAVEPRVQVVPPRGRVAVAVGLTAGVAGSEYIFVTDVDRSRQTRFEGFVFATSVTLGVDLQPDLEFVFAPRAYLLIPARSTAPDRPGLGAIAGLRFVDPARTWAVQPELAVARVDGETLVTVGLSVGVGD